MRRTLPFVIGIAVVITAAACGGGAPPPPPQPNADSLAAVEEARRRAAEEEARRRAAAEEEARRRAAEEERLRRERESRAETEAVRGIVGEMINFDFDRSDVRPGDASVLDRKLAVLQANPGLMIEIVGHCDERGSDEYNLALGNRRALAAKQYLVSRGIADNRITTRSMGEEQPLDAMSNEDAWARNRRDEFQITGGGDMLRRPAGM